MKVSAGELEFALSLGRRFTSEDESILLEFEHKQPDGFWAAVWKANRERCDKQKQEKPGG